MESFGGGSACGAAWTRDVHLEVRTVCAEADGLVGRNPAAARMV